MESATVEDQRLHAIERLGAMDRLADPTLAGLARLAAQVTGAAMAAIHIIDANVQRRIAAHGVELGDHPRADAICTRVIEEERALHASDASEDARFEHSSLVRGKGALRFYAAAPLRTSEDAVIGTLAAFDTAAIEVPEERLRLLGEIAQQAVNQIEMQARITELGAAASEDALTGAANRLILSDRLGRGLARLSRHEEDLLVGMVDLDHFKQVNDTLGHAAGDAVLCETAGRLSSSLRREDTVARFGGDEFVVLVGLEAGAIEPEAIRKRLCEALAEPFEIEGRQLQIGATVGSVLAREDETTAAVLERADHEMYVRKRERHATGRFKR